jgi:class 3 adenylate cyclase
MTPETHYAKSGDVRIAYQVVGDGPVDLLYAAGWVTNVEIMWEDPGFARFLNRMASFTRLICFDKRGIGLSDAVPAEDLANLDIRMQDMKAVMDAVGSERAFLFGHSEGGSTCIRFAHDYPERTAGLILAFSYAKRLASPDYPWAPTMEERIAQSEGFETSWSEPQTIAEYYAPSRAGDEAFVRWLSRYLRLAASPKAAAALNDGSTYVDVTRILPEIKASTLCLYRKGDPDVKIEEGRYIASNLPHARLVEVEGDDHFFWAGDPEPLLEEIEEFITGQRGPAEPERVVATALFTDIVGSTELAASVGDQAWRDLLHRHDETIRTELARWRGREVKTTGDGVLATFDSPSQAIRFAKVLPDSMMPLGIKVRCGMHTGEMELRGEDVAGLAVHIAARICSLAGPSEVLVSRTVKDLLAGSGIEFESRGPHSLKGVPEEWDVYAVT